MSRLSNRNLIAPAVAQETSKMLHINKTGSLPATTHRFCIEHPIRDSAIAAVKKQFSRTHPDLATRFEKHFSQMCKMKPYGLIEVKLKEYNMTIVFFTLKKDLEEMTYSVENLDFKPCEALAKKSMFSWLLRRSL